MGVVVGVVRLRGGVVVVVVGGVLRPAGVGAGVDWHHAHAGLGVGGGAGGGAVAGPVHTHRGLVLVFKTEI